MTLFLEGHSGTSRQLGWRGVNILRIENVSRVLLSVYYVFPLIPSMSGIVVVGYSNLATTCEATSAYDARHAPSAK